MDNKTLTFNPVMMSDNGNYSCMASNSISNMTSEWFLLKVFCEYLKCLSVFPKLDFGGFKKQTKKTVPEFKRLGLQEC